MNEVHHMDSKPRNVDIQRVLRQSVQFRESLDPWVVVQPIASKPLNLAAWDSSAPVGRIVARLLRWVDGVRELVSQPCDVRFPDINLERFGCHLRILCCEL